MYEEQRKAWIKRNRRIFLVLDTLTVAVVVAGFVVWRLVPATAWYAGLLTGMVLSFDLLARLNPPTWIEQWQSGSFGEERTAHELAKLGSEWLVAHDLSRRGEGNIDHVVVGPPGVYLLDTKNIGTEVRIEDDTLVAYRPDGRVRYRTPGPARAIRGAARELSETLAQAGARSWVNGVIVVWGDMPAPHVAGRQVHWVAGSALAGWLAQQPPERDLAKLDRVRAVLSDYRRAN